MKTLETVNTYFEVENYTEYEHSKGVDVRFDVTLGLRLSNLASLLAELDVNFGSVQIDGASNNDGIVTGVSVSFTILHPKK